MSLQPKLTCRLFLSTPSARRATLLLERSQHVAPISIHALREEGDVSWYRNSSSVFYFYPRPPRGGRPFGFRRQVFRLAFLSTPSARRATTSTRSMTTSTNYFYPRPPRGGRPAGSRNHGIELGISIHALREEGDSFVRPLCRRARYFYPRPPRGGRPPVDDAGELQDDISIHALREEGDEVLDAIGERQDVFLSTPSARRATRARPHPCLAHGYFYPRPPRGGRPISIFGSAIDDIFLSTPSARRATRLHRRGLLRLLHFYPRPPRGGRRPRWPLPLQSLYFYPRPPRGGRHQSLMMSIANTIFLSTPSARRATAKTETKSLFSYKLYNILHEFRRALIYNGSKNYPNHAK